MPPYFTPVRRKFGVAILVLACVFTAGWIQSLRVDYLVQYQQQTLISIDGGLVWEMPTQQPSIQARDFLFHSRDLLKYAFLAPSFTSPTPADRWRWSFAGFVIAEYTIAVTTAAGTIELETNRFYRVPYWSIVIPLTLLAAYLLLGRSYPPKKPEKPGSNPRYGPPHQTQARASHFFYASQLRRGGRGTLRSRSP